MPRGLTDLYGKRAAFWLVFLLVTVFFLAGSLWVINFVRGTVVSAAEEPTSTVYVDYIADTSVVSTESLNAIAEYIQEYPEPQNVEVLVGMTTSEIWAYMTTFQSAGLGVDCTYCHSLDNFGAEGDDIGDDVVAERKDNARLHLQMSADLNQNWLTQLSDIDDKQPYGAQIACATCHYGEPQPLTWPAEQNALPDDFRLPLRAEDGSVGTVADIDKALLVTGRDDVYSLDAVQYNQNVMYYQNQSLGVGCTHCHNSRYFPSWEQPAKYYAYTMLQMNQHILGEYYESMNNQDPSCNMCHQGQVIPPGAAISADVLPDMLTTEYVPGK